MHLWILLAFCICHGCFGLSHLSHSGIKGHKQADTHLHVKPRNDHHETHHILHEHAGAPSTEVPALDIVLHPDRHKHHGHEHHKPHQASRRNLELQMEDPADDWAEEEVEDLDEIPSFGKVDRDAFSEADLVETEPNSSIGDAILGLRAFNNKGKSHKAKDGERQNSSSNLKTSSSRLRHNVHSPHHKEEGRSRDIHNSNGKILNKFKLNRNVSPRADIYHKYDHGSFKEHNELSPNHMNLKRRFKSLHEAKSKTQQKFGQHLRNVKDNHHKQMVSTTASESDDFTETYSSSTDKGKLSHLPLSDELNKEGYEMKGGKHVSSDKDLKRSEDHHHKQMVSTTASESDDFTDTYPASTDKGKLSHLPLSDELSKEVYEMKGGKHVPSDKDLKRSEDQEMNDEEVISRIERLKQISNNEESHDDTEFQPGEFNIDEVNARDINLRNSNKDGNNDYIDSSTFFEDDYGSEVLSTYSNKIDLEENLDEPENDFSNKKRVIIKSRESGNMTYDPSVNKTGLHYVQNTMIALKNPSNNESEMNVPAIPFVPLEVAPTGDGLLENITAFFIGENISEVRAKVTSYTSTASYGLSNTSSSSEKHFKRRHANEISKTHLGDTNEELERPSSNSQHKRGAPKYTYAKRAPRVNKKVSRLLEDSKSLKSITKNNSNQETDIFKKEKEKVFDEIQIIRQNDSDSVIKKEDDRNQPPNFRGANGSKSSASSDSNESKESMVAEKKSKDYASGASPNLKNTALDSKITNLDGTISPKENDEEYPDQHDQPTYKDDPRMEYENNDDMNYVDSQDGREGKHGGQSMSRYKPNYSPPFDSELEGPPRKPFGRTEWEEGDINGGRYMETDTNKLPLDANDDPEEFENEEKMEKQSRTILRSKTALRNETSKILGEKKTEIKDNKENYHEAYMQTKDETKIPNGQRLNLKTQNIEKDFFEPMPLESPEEPKKPHADLISKVLSSELSNKAEQIPVQEKKRRRVANEDTREVRTSDSDGTENEIEDRDADYQGNDMNEDKSVEGEGLMKRYDVVAEDEGIIDGAKSRFSLRRISEPQETFFKETTPSDLKDKTSERYPKKDISTEAVSESEVSVTMKKPTNGAKSNLDCPGGKNCRKRQSERFREQVRYPHRPPPKHLPEEGVPVEEQNVKSLDEDAAGEYGGIGNAVYMTPEPTQQYSYTPYSDFIRVSQKKRSSQKKKREFRKSERSKQRR